MKISKKDAYLLLAVIGLGAVVAVYFSVFQPNREKTDALKAENQQLKQQVQDLEVHEAKRETYLSEIATMISEVNTVFDRFPADSKSEDAIMYAVDLEAKDENTYISAIGLSGSQMAYEATPCNLSLEDGSRGEEDHTYRLNKKQINYTHDFTYDGMKRYVTTIVEDENRKSIETINLAFDNKTGILTGNTVMNIFTIEGTDKVYRKTEIPPMSTGTPNIFGTVDEALANTTGNETEGD